MPPYTSLTNYGNDSDGIVLGFTSPLIETIANSRSKIQNWADREKAKMDSAAELYRTSLVEQEELINSRMEELTMVQRELGTDDAATSSEDNRPENIAEQKKSLEEQVQKAQIDIMKLKTERGNRERRVQDMALEESKQRIRADDAAALKRSAEESKKTTIDDLTRGVVNYKKLGLDFTQTGREAELKLNFTEIDPDDPSRIFSFVLIVNEEEKYDITNCNPKVNAIELVDILDELNESGGEDISILARRMRRAFKELCDQRA
mmetsp:Transcript_13823/g.28529  ORF Transcript_13823/g.28529 Transcript_13823/m.28529 type:complete len:263 (+) Transcript_13823:76-864(+)